MKKIMGLFIVCTLVIAAITNPYFSNNYALEAQQLNELGLFDGTRSDDFTPDLESITTRHEAIKIIGTALQWTLDEAAKGPFLDVTDWAAPYVAKAYDLRITSGISITEFGGDREITHRELATWMLRSLGYNHREAWIKTSELSHLIGTEIDSTQLKQVMTRNDLVGMLYNFLKTGKRVNSDLTLMEELVLRNPELEFLALEFNLLPEKNEEDSLSEPLSETPSAKKSDLNLALLVDSSGIERSDFNKMAWEGILSFANAYNLDTDQFLLKQVGETENYKEPFESIAIHQTDLIISVGLLFYDTLNDYAARYPNNNFAIIDDYVERPNVTGVIFKEEEGAFLAGVAAGLKASQLGSKKVAFIGGMDFYQINLYNYGFTLGVQSIDPTIEVITQYAGTFADAALGRSMASDLYRDGVSVIFHAAGATGIGVINEAKRRATNGSNVWVIGSDVDQYNYGLYNENNSVVLTSMVKNVDVAVYKLCVLLNESKLSGGQIELGLKENGVGIAKANPNLNSDWLEQINHYRDKIINGEIEFNF